MQSGILKLLGNLPHSSLKILYIQSLKMFILDD